MSVSHFSCLHELSSTYKIKICDDVKYSHLASEPVPVVQIFNMLNDVSQASYIFSLLRWRE